MYHVMYHVVYHVVYMCKYDVRAHALVYARLVQSKSHFIKADSLCCRHKAIKTSDQSELNPRI